MCSYKQNLMALNAVKHTSLKVIKKKYSTIQLGSHTFVLEKKLQINMVPIT